MKKINTRKKYGYGSTGIGGNYIESPGTTMARNDIIKAKAEQKAIQNPWLPIVAGAGALLQQGMNMYGGKLTQGSDNIVGNLDYDKIIASNENGVIAAYGNAGTTSKQIEVEGGEVIRTPQGQVQPIEGAKHEQGGEDVVVPENSQIYPAERAIKIKGKTLAQRELMRTKKQERLTKYLKDNNDVATKNSVTRQLEALEKERQGDLSLISMMNPQQSQPQQSQETYGRGSTGVQTNPPGYFNKTDVNGLLDLTDSDYTSPINARFTGIPYQDNSDMVVNPNFKKPYSLQGLDYPKMVKEVSYQDPIKMKMQGATTPYNTISADISGLKGTPGEFAIQNPEKNSSKYEGYLPSLGDLTTIAGNIYSGIAPMKNTLENRAGDQPNINAYVNYGKDALKTVNESKGFLDDVRDINKTKIDDQVRASKNANRNGARGINTARALDLATDMNRDKSYSDIYASYANQMSDILFKEAGLQSDRDSKVMAGEQARDLADRQDRDNFYTQLGQDKVTFGGAVQATGNNLNDIKMNDLKKNLLNTQGNLLKMGSNGEISAKDNPSISTGNNSNYIDASLLTPAEKARIARRQKKTTTTKKKK